MRLSSGHLFFLGILLSGMLPGLALAGPVQQQFADWLVTCNNQNFCQARNVSHHHGLIMALSRSAGAKDDMSLRIELGSLYAPPTKLPAINGRLLWRGKPLQLDKKSWQITPHRLKTTNPGVITALLRKLAADTDNSPITLAHAQGSVSLDGLKRALEFIDTTQKRQGNQSAWIDPGDLPPQKTPPAPGLVTIDKPELPVAPLSATELNGLLDYGSWRMANSHCSMDPSQREVRVAPLSGNKAILMVSCESGAYNVVDLVWILNREKPFHARRIRLRLPFNWEGHDKDVELMNTRFADHDQVFVTLNKGRGFADCGVTTRWRYTDEQFRLVRLASQPVCDGQETADAWPTLWVAN